METNSRKTPDEVKWWMGRCAIMKCSTSDNKCPWDCGSSQCIGDLLLDGLALISQKELENAKLLEDQQWMMAERDDLKRYIQQLEAERDAAVADLTEVVQACGEPCCEYCEWNGRSYCAGRCWTHNEGFKWRGVQKEE